MDMLKKELAPLSSRVWEEIEDRAASVLRSRLSARKVVKVNGPKGLSYAAVPEGRLDIVETNGDVRTGIFRVAPLTETRIFFTLNRKELENIDRGAKDIDFSTIDSAVEKIADFEEKAIYAGYKSGGIVGLAEIGSHKPIPFGSNGSAMLQAVAQAVITLRASYASGPLSLVAGTKAWIAMQQEIQGLPFTERIERLIGGRVVHSLAADGAFLLPYNNENFELTIGQDFAIGYDSHDTKEVTLFVTESFTFRVLDPNLLVRFTL